MAAENRTKEVARSSGTANDYYTGSKEALVAAGICQARWFPRTLEKDTRYSPPRTRRTYTIEDREPETTLTHRRYGDGSVYWIVRVAVADDERKRREAEQKQKHEASMREYRERNRKYELDRERSREAAEPIVRQLRSRYPKLTHIEGGFSTCKDGTRRQSLTFYARSLSVLRDYGLATEEMRIPESECYTTGDLKNGTGYFLSEERADHWRVTLHTNEVQKERGYFPVPEARRLLKEIAGLKR